MRAFAACLLRLAVAQDPTAPPGFLGQLQGHQAPIYALATGQNDLAASGSKDGAILVWNLSLPEAEPQRRSGVRGRSSRGTAASRPWPSPGATWSPGPRTTRRGSGIWPLAKCCAAGGTPGLPGVFGLSVSGSLLATACWDGWWRIFELSGSGSSLREVHHGGRAGLPWIHRIGFAPPNSMAFRLALWSALGSALLAGARDCSKEDCEEAELLQHKKWSYNAGVQLKKAKDRKPEVETTRRGE
ncbi:unnamed protein product [Effrenium voratum]|nr:unnamed protein product [Effrenium voratum]